MNLEPFPLTWNPALREILLDHLRSTKTNFWRGIDGLTLDDAVNCYCEAAAGGHVPSKHQLVCQHPELAAELETFFTASQMSSTRVSIDTSPNISTAAVPR